LNYAQLANNQLIRPIELTAFVALTNSLKKFDHEAFVAIHQPLTNEIEFLQLLLHAIMANKI
jgi:hypothetical protein